MAHTAVAGPLCSLERAAQILGTTPMSVLMHLKHRLIEGLEVNGQWYVQQHSLEDYLAKKNAQPDNAASSLCKAHHCRHSSCGSCD